MVLNSQIRKVVLCCVTGVTPNKNVITGHYIARSGKLARTLSYMRLRLVSFVREEHVFEEISTGRGK